MYWSLENVPWTNLHDLNLDWIVNTMKQTVEQWIAYRLEMNQKFEDFTTQVNEDFDAFTAQINEWKTQVNSDFAELQQYVQDYFDNLDLNESTRYVINQMIASGEFIQVLNPSIVSATETWLASHITPTTPAIDDTLSISGAAADAKATGDVKITTNSELAIYGWLNSQILGVNLFPASGYTDGKYLTYNTGVESTNPQYFYTNYIPVVPSLTYTFNVSTGHICFYDISKTYKSGVLLTTSSTITIPANCNFMRVSLPIANRSTYQLYAGTEIPGNTLKGKSYFLDAIQGTMMKISPSAVLVSNYSVILPDLDNVENNTIYLLVFPQYEINRVPANFPFGIMFESCIVFTVKTNNKYHTQYVFGRSGIFNRMYVSGAGWQPWTVIKKPILNIQNGQYLIRVSESGIPCTLDITANIELYQSYLAEKGSDYWTNYVGYSQSGDRNDSGIYVHPHVSLNGNMHTLTFNPTTKTEAMMRDFSPINCGGDNLIENLIINIGVRNCRYAIHDDFALATEGVHLKNILMRGTGVSPAQIGAGVKPYSNHIVENCVCLDNDGDCDILYHSSTQEVQAASFLVIKDCYCEKDIDIKYVGVNQVLTPCLVTNNHTRKINYGPGSGETPYRNMLLLKWNNEETNP